MWEAAKFNDRLQVTELGLGNTAENMNLWKINYEYGEIDSNGNLDASKNTGNPARQTISFAGLTQPFVQTYKYDSLYRLKEAKETNNGSQTWIQNFGYDRYGNRTTLSQNINGNQLALNNVTHPTINPNTNRFNTGQGYIYDKVGNLIADADGRSFTFDGNNKQTLVTNGSGTVGEYFYDGDGKRVKKNRYDSAGNLAETVIFVYSGGKLVEEYSTQPTPQNPTTKYVATDTLQSVRAISDQNGEVISRRDFLPFGEELPADSNLRTSSFKYAAQDDGIRQKFTGYEKDEETGLDFAQARMYNNQHARFTAVDPLLASGKSGNPQTFNRYVYVMNSPLVLTDPTGLQAASCINCDVYWDGERTYRVGAKKGFIRYDGPEFTDNFTDGYRYTFSSNKRILVGKSEKKEQNRISQPQNSVHPFNNPKGVFDLGIEFLTGTGPNTLLL